MCRCACGRAVGSSLLSRFRFLRLSTAIFYFLRHSPNNLLALSLLLPYLFPWAELAFLVVLFLGNSALQKRSSSFSWTRFCPLEPIKLATVFLRRLDSGLNVALRDHDRIEFQRPTLSLSSGPTLDLIVLANATSPSPIIDVSCLVIDPHLSRTSLAASLILLHTLHHLGVSHASALVPPFVAGVDLILEFVVAGGRVRS